MDDRPLVADKMHHGSIDKLLVWAARTCTGSCANVVVDRHA